MNAPATAEHVALLDVNAIASSSTQPRKHGREPDGDMIASVREKGILQPIVVVERAKKSTQWMLVFGERRWLAATKCGHPTVPAIIRQMSDEQIVEAQVIENNQRQDLHPLDEADGFQALVDRGQKPHEIAAKIGRSLSYVTQRLKLCSLCAAGRKALDQEHITFAAALEVAKLPDAKIQSQAVVRLVAYDGLATVKQAQDEIEGIMCRLGEAPFDLKDAVLCPDAGSCYSCAKRTGNQQELFPDASSPDLCTDPPCYKQKLEVYWKGLSKEHKAKGGRVLSQKDAKAVLGNSWSQEAKAFVHLDQKDYSVSPSGKKVRTLLKDHNVPVVLGQDPRTGLPVELVAKLDAEPILKKLRPKPTVNSVQKKLDAARLAQNETAKRERETLERAYAQITERAPKHFAGGTITQAMAEVLLHGACELAWHELVKSVAKRHEVPEGKETAGERVERWARNRPAPELLRFLLELLVAKLASGDADPNVGDEPTAFERACKLLNVDVPALRDAAERDAKQKAAATKAPARKAKKKAGSKGSK